MPKLVKNGQIVDNDDWAILDDEQCATQIPEKSFISLQAFLNASPDALPSSVGVYLKNDDEVQELEGHLSLITKVACIVDNFMDGRNFSQARILREQMGFEGDIRAMGSFILDQLFFLKRCGFNEFSFDEDIDLSLIQESLNDFSDSYQAACDISEPLFRRRS